MVERSRFRAKLHEIARLGTINTLGLADPLGRFAAGLVEVWLDKPDGQQRRRNLVPSHKLRAERTRGNRRWDLTIRGDWANQNGISATGVPVLVHTVGCRMSDAKRD